MREIKFRTVVLLENAGDISGEYEGLYALVGKTLPAGAVIRVVVKNEAPDGRLTATDIINTMALLHAENAVRAGGLLRERTGGA